MLRPIRGPESRGICRWLESLFGISLITGLLGALAKDLMGIWPRVGFLILLITLIVVVVLSWFWVKRVRRAAKDGEFD